MAEDKRESIEELAEETSKVGQVTMKLGLDVSEALTGLKAVERQAKAAKRAVAELGDKQPKQLSDYSTKELADELIARTSVFEYYVPDGILNEIKYGKGRRAYDEGGSRIVVIKD
jgi:hypothetical protein